ncbi:pilus assembly protein, partial [Corallococcus sp. AB038B]
QIACVNATCRTNAACCSEVGPDVIIPDTMNAASVHGLCYLPGMGRAVRPGNLGCMQGQLDNTAALAAAAPGNLQLNFNAESGRPRSLLMVEPLTGLASLLDCDSKQAENLSVPACTAQPPPY